MLEEVPTEELQPAEAAADAGKDRAGAAAEQDRHLGRPGLRILLRRLPRRRLPAARAAGSQGAAADREHALDGELALRSPDVAAVDADRRRRCCATSASAIIGNLDDDGYLVASFDELAAMGPWPVGRRRARAAAGSELRSDRRRRARSAGVPAAAAAPSRARGHADREDRHRAPAAAAEPSGAGDRAQARDDDRRSQGAHRDHPAPRSEAGQPLQPDAVAVRHPRRLRHQGRGSVRRGAERGRPAADAHQPGLPPAARQERRRTTPTRRAPT